MTREPSLESYLDALREDLPSEGTEARLQQRLASMGIGLSVVLATKTAAATCAAPVTKVGVLAALSARFAELPLLWQMGLVTATTAAVATGPLVVMTAAPAARNHETVQMDPRTPFNAREPSAPSLAAETRSGETSRRDGVPAGDAPYPNAAIGANAAPAPMVRSAERRLETTSPSLDSLELRSLAEETRLIDRALASIRAGRLGDAAQQLDEHERRFPDGRLKREQRRAREKLEEARGIWETSTSN